MAPPTKSASPAPSDARGDELRDVDARIDQLTFQAGATEPARPAPRRAPGLFQGVLIATDGSPGAERALAWGAALAKLAKAPATVATCVPPGATLGYAGESSALLYDAQEDAARQVLHDGTEFLRAAGLRPNGVLASGAPAREIVQAAERERADIVVLGAHGHGPLGRALLGSVADGIKDNARGSVLIAKSAPPPTQVLIATDGSRASKHAAAVGLALAKAWKAHVTILHAVAPPSFGPLERGMRAFDYAVEGLNLRSWKGERLDYDLEFGSPADIILRRASDLHADLIVLGTRGLTGLQRLGAGSVSNRVAHEAKASVLLVRGEEPSV
jgi:nucleotide-binding universal stress UspA family protein